MGRQGSESDQAGGVRRNESRAGADSERGLESARRSSSLPSGVFRAGSPTVERELAQNVGDLFLRHMSCTDRPERTGEVLPPPDPDAERRNHVDAAELAELVAELRQRRAVAAPRIDAGLVAERSWILLNLAAHGSPRLRALAERELLDAMADPAQASALDEALLEAIAKALPADPGAAPRGEARP